MKLVAGLGNPGRKYKRTRHNVGFEVMDLLAERHGVTFETAPADALQARWRAADDVVLIVKPLTFMNVSGQAVSALCRFFKLDVADVLIVCDDVNLPLGRLRARADGSDGGHNGLKSIAEHLGATNYARLRIGVGRGDLRRDLASHVLASFEPEEEPVVMEAVTRSADAVDTWVSRGIAAVMNTFNRAE